jgi:hypothetical protein
MAVPGIEISQADPPLRPLAAGVAAVPPIAVAGESNLSADVCLTSCDLRLFGRGSVGRHNEAPSPTAADLTTLATCESCFVRIPLVGGPFFMCGAPAFSCDLTLLFR